MAFNYAEQIGSLHEEERLHFYEILAHQLTIAARIVWSDETLTDSQKVSQLKCLNEVLHRVTVRVYSLRLRTDVWTEVAMFESMRHWISPEPTIGPLVGWAITQSYEVVTGLPADQIVAELGSQLRPVRPVQ